MVAAAVDAGAGCCIGEVAAAWHCCHLIDCSQAAVDMVVSHAEMTGSERESPRWVVGQGSLAAAVVRQACYLVAREVQTHEDASLAAQQSWGACQAPLEGPERRHRSVPKTELKEAQQTQKLEGQTKEQVGQVPGQGQSGGGSEDQKQEAAL